MTRMRRNRLDKKDLSVFHCPAMKICIIMICVVVMSLTGCATSGPAAGGTASTAVSGSQYAALGLFPGHVAAWEDGARTTGGAGTYEWWYFDFNLDDGSTLVVTYLTKDFTRPQTELAPFVTFTLDRPGASTVSKVVTAAPADFSASRDRCDVRIGANTARGDLHDYAIHFEQGDVRADLTLHGTVPPWRPGTGFSFFGGDKGHYFAWLPSVPQGTVAGTVSIAGQSRTVSGVGYHDHNWGDASMLDLIHDWYWGRAQIGSYTVIASYITASGAFGSTPLPIFMLARDGVILADDAAKVRFSTDGVFTDPYTGKPVAGVVAYDYDDGTSRYRVTFRRGADLVRTRFVDMLGGFESFLARLSGFDGAYLRFTGTVTLERWDAEKIVETRSESSAVWELMYFGHAPGR
jgi:predicted secreted hydrolase